MSHLILSHLSKNNNKPEIVQALFDKHAGEIKVVVASRYCETPVFHITGANTGGGVNVTHRIVKLRKAQSSQPLQLNLFQ
jgi:hypothetical protein